MVNPHFTGYSFVEHIVYGLANFLDDFSEKILDLGSKIEIDEEILESIPVRCVEKKRKTRKPSEGILDFCTIKNFEVSVSQIKIHSVLDGFDEEAMRLAKNKIADACRFIFGNAEAGLEKKVALQLMKMLWKGSLLLTDTELVLGKQMAAYFNTVSPAEASDLRSVSRGSPLDGIPHIGLDIAVFLKEDNANTVEYLIHEAYHAWRYYTSHTEYSIIDETRAWNAGLRFSNKYRTMYGMPVRREEDYTADELMNEYREYAAACNIKIRFGQGETVIEKIGYGIANVIEDATDKINEWTENL
jgi:hypothetical protein